MTRINNDSRWSPEGRTKLLAAAVLMAAITAIGCGQGSSEATAEMSEAPPEEALLSTLDAIGGEVDDAVVGLRVRMQLLQHLDADALGVDVGVSSGEVVLSGAVDEPASKSLAKEVALSVDGVDAVSNLIEVRAEGDRRPVAHAVAVTEREVSDALLLTRIKLQLAQELGSDALDIDVDVKDGQVSLRGSLPDSEHKSIAIKTARAVKGVGEVHDLLDVRS